MKLFEVSKLENYLIIFIRILWFIWDVGLLLFDSHKDFFFFLQYFVLSGGKLVPEIDQNHRLCVCLDSISILKPLFEDCLYLIKGVRLVKISTNSIHISGRKGLETPQNGPFHGFCMAIRNNWKFVTFHDLCTSIGRLIWQKIGV